jgi:L-2-hydroxyglutarate oxidase LhgO
MDVLVIGVGIIGLSLARALAQRGHGVIVAEATGGIGNGVSSRNSEVIHAGMYYPSGSLRARHCVAGRRMLYAFCESHGVPHARCGKLIVATNELEQSKIEGIYEQGLANGVEGLSFLSREQARTLEPNLACTGAVLSSETGIVDSHALMLALQGDLESAGGVIAFHAPVERIAKSRTGWNVHVGGGEPTEIAVDAVVNAAGLGAQELARSSEGYRSCWPKAIISAASASLPFRV